MSLNSVPVDYFEEHRAAVLVEPFRACVDVVLCTCVGTADDLRMRMLALRLQVGGWESTMTVISSS